MTDTLEFDIAQRRAGITKREIAKQLGLSEMGLYKKINNISEFKASELAKLYQILHLETLEQQQRVFFAHDVDFKSTATAE